MTTGLVGRVRENVSEDHASCGSSKQSERGGVSDG